MKNKTPKELTVEWFERVWNQRDETAAAELMAADCEVKGLDLPAPGPEGFLPMYRKFLRIFESINIRILELAEEGDLAIGHAQFTALHKETQNQLDFPFSLSGRWKDGKLAEARNVVDYFTLLAQMGLLGENLLPTALKE